MKLYFFQIKIFREKLVCPGENGDLSFFIKIMDVSFELKYFQCLILFK
jgi:hypothetical protein